MPTKGRFVYICCAGSQTVEKLLCNRGSYNKINDKQAYFKPLKTEANQNYI